MYFEGVATKATVYFNGCLLKHSFTGFTPFEVDITDYINFDGDIAVFTCYAVDNNGNAVPDTSEYVNFFTNAKGDVVDTGSDISDHNPVWLPSRKMRAGTITIAVKLNKNDIDELKLFAKGDTLGNAVISVKL